MKNILIISPEPTHPPYAGNRICILSYAEMLRNKGYKVSFLWIANFNYLKQEEILTRAYWKNNLYIFKKNQIHRIKEAFFRYYRFKRLGFFKVDDNYPLGVKKLILQIQKKEQINVLIINYIYLSKIFNYINGIKKILFTHDVFTNRYQITGQQWFSVSASEEAKALQRSDVILAIQESEATFYRTLTSKKILTTYSYFPIVETKLTGKKNLLYLAGPNVHNKEAIIFFINTIFKSLVKAHPQITLLIGGGICPEIEEIIDTDQVELLGDITDLNEFYAKGDIFINPTFNGTGLKIKTFEAMAHGKVVISHPHAVIGIYNKETAPILIAENLKEYTNYINYLFQNKEHLIKLKEASIQYIQELNEVITSRFIDAIEN